MIPDRKHRHSKLMQIFDLENDFVRHRDRILRTQSKDVSATFRKNYNSQMEIINSFRRNWVTANNYRELQKQKEICQSNRLLQDSIVKQYNRQVELGFRKSRLNRTTTSNSSSRASLTSASNSKRKSIAVENARLLKKIESIESDLSKSKLDTLYQKALLNKERLEVMSSKNKQKLKRSLNRMHIDPVVFFPKMKLQKLSTIK